MGTTTYDLRAFNIAEEVLEERKRQDAKWGEQNHPDGTGDVPGSRIRVRQAEHAREVCQAHAAGGTVSWLDILREEVAEAFAESDPAKLRAELVQVSAVAQQWIEAIDRRSRRVLVPEEAVEWMEPGCTCNHRFGTELGHNEHCAVYDPDVSL